MVVKVEHALGGGSTFLYLLVKLGIQPGRVDIATDTSLLDAFVHDNLASLTGWTALVWGGNVLSKVLGSPDDNSIKLAGFAGLFILLRELEDDPARYGAVDSIDLIGGLGMLLVYVVLAKLGHTQRQT